MIRGLEHDHVALACVRARETQRQLVRFAGRVDEEAHVQRWRERRDETLGVFREMIVEIASVGVEHRHLCLRSAHDAWMTVPNVRNVVVGVEIATTLVVEQVLPPAASDAHRIAIRDAQVAAEEMATTRERLRSAQGRGWKTR